MNVFFCSDTHFFHSNIIKYCSRPFCDAEEMNSEMVRRWNMIVDKDDVCIHVGDFSAGLKGREDQLSDVIRSLNGKKLLIRGNHDHQDDDWYLKNGFFQVHDFLNIGKILLIHYPLSEAISRGFDHTKFGVVEHVVHGHVHSDKNPNFENHFNVAADRNQFSPVRSTVAIPQELHDRFFESLVTFLDTIDLL